MGRDGGILTATRRDHVAGFYDGDDDLVAGVVPFITDGLASGDGAVLLATPAHLVLLDGALRGHGLEVDRLRDDGLLVTLDAATTLAAVCVDGVPDRDRFREVIGNVVVVVATRARRVRAFGEMVGLLWAEGDVAGALALESFWNELCGRYRLSLWCAYPATSLADGDLHAVADVCSHHSELVGPSTDGPAAGAAPAGPTASATSQVFLPIPSEVRAVRRFTHRTLASWGAAGVAGTAVVVASELATNALLHASSPFRVTMRRSRTSVTIAVTDCDPARPRRAGGDPDAVSGRGLAIVDGLSSRWGTETGPDGKTVWATLTTS